VSELAKIIGHRGAAGLAPENTLGGFGKAKDAGAKWVEFDVRITRDSRLAVIHDADLERTTNGRGRVADHDMAELGELDAGSWFETGGAFAGERVPSLEEALELLGDLGLGANIEVKPTPGREREAGRRAALIAAQSGRRDAGSPLLSSFDTEALSAAREASAELPLGLLLSRLTPGWEGVARTLGCFSLHCDHKEIDRARAQRIKDEGLKLLVYTVNKPARARELLAWGVDSVITDVPDLLLAGL
jgi:glycerophosphoryl diester phosphodiesterase